MKAYERMILTYIDKYKNINFDYFYHEFSIGKIQMLGILEKLLKNEFIKFEDNKLIVTDKGKSQKYDALNKLMEVEDNIPDFDWTKLYIPKNFKNIL